MSVDLTTKYVEILKINKFKEKQIFVQTRNCIDMVSKEKMVDSTTKNVILRHLT